MNADKEKKMQWILNNKEWVFSGIGVFFMTIIFTVLYTRNKSNSQKQKSGIGSINIQAGGHINIGNNNDK
jgi:hypothetical protein